jgi:predicted MFS family arabinose efflux permease
MLNKTYQLYVGAFSGLSKDVWLLSLVTLINRSGAMVVPFLTIYLTSQLGFTLTQAGFVMSVFGTGSLLGTLIGGKLTDRFGYYPVQFWTLLLSGVLFFFLMRAHSFPSMCLSVFVLSLVAEAFRPANMAAIRAYSKYENRTRSVTLMRLAINLGFVVGPAAGGFLAATMGYSWIFIIDGLTCIAAAFLLILLLKNKPIHEEESNAPAGSGKESPLQDRIYLMFLPTVVLTATAFMQLFSTVPVYLKTVIGIDDGHIGLIMALSGIIIVLFEMPVIYALEKNENRLQLIGWGALLIGASYLVILLGGAWAGVGFAYITVVTFGEIINFPFANSYAIDRTSPKNVGVYMSFYSMSFSLAFIIAPSLGMFMASHFGYEKLWLVCALLCAISFLCLYFLKKIDTKSTI